MLYVEATPEWCTTYPGAQIGLLELSQAENSGPCAALEEQKRILATSLRRRYRHLSRAELICLPVMDAYVRYYKRFDKTYHVLLQLESLLHKGKDFHQVSPLVDANFMAELETFMLTAGHDADKLCGKLWIDVARQGETFCQMGGAIKRVAKNDMVLRDEHGICCSVLYGQDNRSPITPQTTHVLYVTYAPPGIPASAIHAYWQKVLNYVRCFSPRVNLEQQRILVAA
ncbi:MAG: phenylalanine--tRNA ligase beta subunit-related protein [Anaerolineales bacterium]|nr:phenylalanine--tRNA ligase beta subunit-related protein [Anaerolineales bacterium]MDW8446888.1 phenylalanine--tRNA ligase beta subunit-related protein [Anaerolineales bacterium]